ncbi:DNA mismatch repair protein MutS [Dichotomocladium elegans]|nr:DNA mismatch repair protein MutS [Dichotomocladium elegans]
MCRRSSRIPSQNRWLRNPRVRKYHRNINCVESVASTILFEYDMHASSSSDTEVYQRKGVAGTTKRTIVTEVANRALGIFETDQHPNTHQRRGKESLSLFGLLNHAVSPIGQHLLKSWLQRPTLDLETIRFRQQSISRFVSAGIEDLTKELRSHLRHVKNVSRLISAVSEHCATSGDWQQLLQFVYHGSKVYVIFQSMVDPILYIRRKILSAIDEKLFRRVGDAINETIDFAQSKAEGRVVVKQHVDPELDQLKDTYAGLDSVLLEVAEEISPELPPVLRAISNVVYFPQLGYFVSIGREHEGMFEHNMGLPPSFRLQFKTAETAYFKNDRTKELDDSLGDVHEMIVDREIELLHDLTERLSEYFPPLLDMADACAELDCLLALAHVARLHNYVQPELTLDNRVEITQGRHPLHELTVDVFIPNDTILVGGLGLRPSEQTEGSRMTVSADGERDDEDTIRASVALLTGANFSGKSVYVRQVALIVYMAHIGSFVPASRAIIGLTDKMFTCVQAAETVSKPMSAFALDIEQLSQAIHHATERSLVVIDEFGSGTDIMDGAALLCATIEYLLAKEAKCPKVLAITHFHDLLAQKLISSDDPRISLLTMEILSQAHRVGMPNCTKSSSSSSSSSTQVDEVVFLYRVAPGTQATNSYGAWCASIAGVPPAIVRRALQLSHLIDNNLPIKPEYSHAEQTLLDNIESAVQTFLGTSIAAENIKSLRELVRRVNEMI